MPARKAKAASSNSTTHWLADASPTAIERALTVLEPSVV
jgi:hypothetical protein